ncbi:metal-dependent hydrolase family protein [Kordiimonas aquimaris]|uniref:metal-dependent hydrolase family protein n=1 Tax=Kordiimonas aquimaris TaxID=707591 RepID=UPI0021CE9653|nr:amidohydrolase family protein [Kordiimonas aquimaris]
MERECINLYLKNVSVFNGHDEEVLPAQNILIEEGRFAKIGHTVPSSQNVHTLDMTGKFLMPGLIDAHFHAYASDLDFAKLDQLPQTYHALKGSELLSGALRRGFTTVRDVGGADYGLWQGLEDGLFTGPRLFYAGKALSQTGGHGDMRPPSLEPCACGSSGMLTKVVDGVDNIRAAAREELRRGASHIKVFVSGGISSPSDPIWSLQYSDPELEAVVDEVTRRGAYVVAHAYTPEAIARSVKAGIRSIEHANLITPEVAGEAQAAGAFVVPTLITYDSLGRYGHETGAPDTMIAKLDEVASKGLESIRICREAGVKIGFGTDLLGELHKFQRQEILLRSKVETPFQILNSATAVNAELMGLEREIGIIQEGTFADFLMLNTNPLQELSSLANGEAIEAVYQSGRRVG